MSRREYNAEDLITVLRHHGFVECDIPACNCGSWHARYGVPERLREIYEILSEQGVISNETGNLASNGLRKLIADHNAVLAARDARIAELEKALRQKPLHVHPEQSHDR